MAELSTSVFRLIDHLRNPEYVLGKRRPISAYKFEAFAVDDRATMCGLEQQLIWAERNNSKLLNTQKPIKDPKFDISRVKWIDVTDVAARKLGLWNDARVNKNITNECRVNINITNDFGFIRPKPMPKQNKRFGYI